MPLILTGERAERQRVYWTPWPIHWSRSHTKHFNWARYNNGSLHNVGISWRACQPVYGNSNIFDWKIFSATEYFAFCFLQEILIWLVVIYFLFHIFFLAANRLSIDTGTIHPILPSDSEGVTAQCSHPIRGHHCSHLTNQRKAIKLVSIPAIIANYEAMKVRDSVRMPDRCRINFYQLMTEGTRLCNNYHVECRGLFHLPLITNIILLLYFYNDHQRSLLYSRKKYST